MQSPDPSSSGPTPDGWRVIDFWESRAQFDTSAAGRIGTAAATGSTIRPELEEFPIHEYVSR